MKAKPGKEKKNKLEKEFTLSFVKGARSIRVMKQFGLHPKSPQSRNTSASSAYSSQGGSEESLDEPLNQACCQSAPKNLKEVKDSWQSDGQVFNFQDIHGNYAKRRYKNVESKVGRYIASIRAEERKRRAAKLVRCSSAPINYSVPTTVVGEDATSEEQLKGFSTNDLYKLHESTSDYVDTETMTSSAYSNSTQGAGTSSNGASRHESSDDAVNGTDFIDFIDKQTYTQLIFEKEHLEVLLEDKRTECLRHKRNVDFLRIELTNCQDELKRTRDNSSDSNLRYSAGFVGYSFAARPNYSLETLHMPNVVSKETQTEFVQTVEILGTPKRISTNANILRLRLNSNSFNRKIRNIGVRSTNYSEPNNPNCKTKICKLPETSPSNSPIASTKSSNLEFTCNDHHYAPVAEKNICADSIVSDGNSQGSDEMHKIVPATDQKSCRRISSFRQRFNRFFGRCVGWDDSNQSSDAYGDPGPDRNIEVE